MHSPFSGIPATYDPHFIADPEAVDLFHRLRDVNSVNVPYTYGRGAGVRTYHPQPDHPTIAYIRGRAEAILSCRFEVCFINRYHDQRDHLGWHSDDSPEMDDARPIAIVSLGVARDIMFRIRPDLEMPADVPIHRLNLGSGSLCVMAEGMQETHQHRIPKAGFVCGERISLTLRGVPEAIARLGAHRA